MLLLLPVLSKVSAMRYSKVENPITPQVYGRFTANACVPSYADYLLHITRNRIPVEAQNLQILRCFSGLVAEVVEYIELLAHPSGCGKYDYPAEVDIGEVVSEAGDVLFWYSALTYYLPDAFPIPFSDDFLAIDKEETEVVNIVNQAEKYTRANDEKYLTKLVSYVTEALQYVVMDAANRLYALKAVDESYEYPDLTTIMPYVELLRKANHDKLSAAPRIRNVS